MIIRMPELTGYATVRHVAVSLPYVDQLIDGVKYMTPETMTPLEGTELRRARAPSLRFLVKLAARCESAEELGKKLRRQYQRQAKRAGSIGGPLQTDRIRKAVRLASPSVKPPHHNASS